jgi:hypothetical protein
MDSSYPFGAELAADIKVENMLNSTMEQFPVGSAVKVARKKSA